MALSIWRVAVEFDFCLWDFQPLAIFTPERHQMPLLKRT